jgi:predicted RNA methylase
MNAATFNRLHALRMDNDAARFAQMDMKPRFDRLAGRHENGTAPRAVSAFQLFQTPPDIAARLVASVGNLAGLRVLEPSAGLGRILDAIRNAGNAPAEVVAVEMAQNIAGELYRQERAGVRLVQRDFLDCTRGELGEFDAVLMNPPFHLRADIRHIEHARVFLKPGGTLAALCLNTHHRETALRPLSASWEILPAGTFGKEGTQVETVLLTIKK